MARTCAIHMREEDSSQRSLVSLLAVEALGASSGAARGEQRQAAAGATKLTCHNPPCVAAFLWRIDYSGSATLVREESVPGQREIHQQIDTSWSLPSRLSAGGGPFPAMFIPRNGRPLPAWWTKPSQLRASGGQRSVVQHTTETYRNGTGSFTCTGREPVSGGPPIHLITRLTRADGAGGYVMDFMAPEPELLPSPRRTACSPQVTTGGRRAMALNLADAFDLSLPAALVTSLHPTAGQLRSSGFTLSATVTTTPATSCEAGTACTQSLRWAAKLRLRRFAACLVPLVRGPAECSR